MSRIIRVVVANRPRLMRELILAMMADQTDIEIVAEVDKETDIAPVIEDQKPDFLIVGLDRPDERPTICSELLRRFPDLRILALGAEHNKSISLWASLDIHSDSIELSEQGILSALRSKLQTVGGRQ